MYANDISSILSGEILDLGDNYMRFNEANTVRDGIRDYLKKNGWTYISRKDLPEKKQMFSLNHSSLKLSKKSTRKSPKTPGERMKLSTNSGQFFSPSRVKD